MENKNVSNMQPKKGDTTINLPITFDFSGGRRDAMKSRKFWGFGLAVVGVIIGLGIMFSKRHFFLIDWVLGLVFMFIVWKIITLFIFQEKRVRKEQEWVDSRDMKLDWKPTWGIFDVEEQFPHICRFRNNLSGVFIMLNKDVIMGKIDDAEYEHYEAIADAYNIAGSSDLRLCHIDFMDVIGSDERLAESRKEASMIKNPDLQDLMADVLNFLEDQMQQSVTSFDCYLLQWSGSDAKAWYTVEKVLDCFMEANYCSYYMMDSKDLQEMQKALFNLHDFSVKEACLTSLGGETRETIVPISLRTADGEFVKINKTKAEKQEEARQRAIEEEAKKKVKKDRKKNKRKHQSGEDIDLFG